MKRRVRQNLWGNWKGYEGRKQVTDFGIDATDAFVWLATGEPLYSKRIELDMEIYEQARTKAEASFPQRFYTA